MNNLCNLWINMNISHRSQRMVVPVIAAITLLAISAQAEPIPPEQSRWQNLHNPSAPGSLAPRLLQSEAGTVYLSWLQKQATSAAGIATRADTGAGHALKFARLQTDSDPLSFAPARRIASGSGWFANWADTPALYIHSDSLWLAHWLQKSAASTYAYDIMLTTSSDQGVTWSEPFIPHQDNTPTEHGFVSYFPMAEDRLGMIWLDGRETQVTPTHDHGGAMTLRTAVVDIAGNISQSKLLDQRVCDCCQTAAVRTSDAAVIAYRNRTEDEIRDIAVMRLDAQGWSEPVIVHHDGWRIKACPVNGPGLAARGRQLALAWFTMAADNPRIHLALSSDAGRTFTAPQVFASGTALGRVQLLAYADGWLLSWMDQPHKQGAAVIRLAGLNAAGRVQWQQQLSGLSAERASGIPRMAVLTDGGIVMAWTAAVNGQSVIRTTVFYPGSE